MLGFCAVVEGDYALCGVEIDALVMLASEHVVEMKWSYLVVNYELDWSSLALFLQSTVHEHLMHILSMEHVVSEDLLASWLGELPFDFTHGCPHFSS